MGTRHLIAVQLDGEYKIAQYGQWDGYPSGQGLNVLNFLQAANLAVFREKLRKLKWATSEQINNAWIRAGAKPGSDLVSVSVGEKLEKANPELSRNTGARILDIVSESTSPEGLLMQNNIGFAQDSLFCEWAYVVDMDKNTLEVYKGFNHFPVTEGRFVGPVYTTDDGPGSRGYGPVELVQTYQLDALPSEAQFLADLEPKDGLLLFRAATN